MTEAEWDSCTDAPAMLWAARGRGGERTLRLLACACARSRWDGLVEPEFRRAVEAAEAVADGHAGQAELRGAADAVCDLLWGEVGSDPQSIAAAQACVDDFAATAAARAVETVPDAGLVREVLGNPFRLRPAPGEGFGSDARVLARAVYDGRRFDGLPRLADLLATGGCRDEPLLTHLRSPGSHARGCWALDAVLGLGPGKPPVTEGEWLGETHPFVLLRGWEYLRGEPTARKRRLLAAACCRRRWPRVAEEPLRRALEAAEAHADGRFPSDELARLAAEAWALGSARGEVLSQTSSATPGRAELADAWAVACAVATTAGPDDTHFGNAMHYAAADGGRGRDTEDAGQAALTRDVLGHPLRPVPFDPRWRCEAAVGLARAAYDTRDFSLLPVLADALEEGGCDDPDVLAHCRGDGPHAPGCWVVDLMLGLE